MNLFTTLMPGVRQLRTPLAVGSLWFVCLYLAGLKHWDSWTAEYAVLDSISSDVRSIPIIYIVGALTFMAYVFGSVTQGLSSLFAEVTRTGVRRIERGVENRSGRIARRWKLVIRRRRGRYPVRSIVMDSVSEKYSSAGKPLGAYLSFPFGMIVGQLESMSLQLWHKAPDQYQESDRLSAESAFRTGVSLPVLLIGVQLGLMTVWWVLVPFGVAAFVLVMQSRAFDQERQGLLANALYQGLVVNVALDTVVRVLGELKLPTKMSIPEWYAATGIAVGRAGEVDAVSDVLREGASELSDGIDFGSVEWRASVDKMVDRVNSIFVDNDEEEHMEFFARMVGAFQSRAEDAMQQVEGAVLRDGDSLDMVGRRGWQGNT